MRRLRSFLLLTVVTLVIALPVGLAADLVLAHVRGTGLEDSLGLPLLYTIRGARPAPSDVLIISMDAPSVAKLDLPPKTRDWPRRLHAELIKRLVSEGASTIVFDLDFSRATTSVDDEALADAMRAARNVVLIEWVDRVVGRGIGGEYRKLPIPLLLASAFGLARAPVPATAVVSETWSFLPDGTEDQPALPATVVQAHAVTLMNPLADLLSRAGFGPHAPIDPTAAAWDRLRQTMRGFRRVLKDNDALAGRVMAVVRNSPSSIESSERMEALLRLYRDPGMFYLNYYGPPGSIRTIPYYRALENASAPLDVQGKVIFVGAGPSTIWNADPADTYYTVYGTELTGVEIQATAFANLLRGERLVPTSPIGTVLLLLGFAGCAVAAGYFLPRRASALAAMALTLVYAGISLVVFLAGRTLLPLAMPLLVELPVALLVVHFARRPLLRQVVRGACLVTDVAGSTSLGGQLPVGQLQELLEGYWLVIERAATRCGGIVQKPQIGDGVVCVWIEPSRYGWRHRVSASESDRPETIGADTRRSSCLAALEIGAAVERFNAVHADHPLPTRIGLHVGKFWIKRDLDDERCTVGGSPINVTQRFQELGKKLFGQRTTRSTIVASTMLAGGLDDFLVRPLGSHDLPGVGGMAACELVGEKARSSAADVERCSRFGQGIALYEQKRWSEARTCFQQVLSSSPDDGPSRYFMNECAARLGVGRDDDSR